MQYESGSNRLTFVGSPRPFGTGGPLVLTPMIDDISLVTLVTRYEEAKGYQPAGGYGGLVPAFYRYGDLRTFFLGGAEQQTWPPPGHLLALTRDCGEAGCWPLTARVVVLDDLVVWLDFAHDYRPHTDYSGLGPYVFERQQYERAVGWAAEMAEREREHREER